MKLQPLHVAMGEVELKKSLTAKQEELLNLRLNALGFEILDNQKQKQIEKIKNLLIQKVQQAELEDHFSITGFLTKSIHKDYSQLSRLFSEVEGSVAHLSAQFKKVTGLTPSAFKKIGGSRKPLDEV